jgi:NAD(P)-dependent dehydrogenase (short-subunit alcohol dehydrogenase family)
MKNAVVTGAGSGVGQAVALSLAKQGWRVALLGRRAEALAETVKLAGERGKQILAIPCDIGDADAVAKMGAQVTQEFGSVEVLVNAAGTNAPKRALEVLSLEDYRGMMDANLNGAYYCVQAFLPGMRTRGSGTIVNVVSDAGKQASPKAGPAYVMSKFGMAGLTQSINAEERGRGVRACAIFPGDIDTPLLNKRPVVPDAEARARMMQPQDIADCVLLCINLPSRVVIEEMLVRPR